MRSVAIPLRGRRGTVTGSLGLAAARTSTGFGLRRLAMLGDRIVVHDDAAAGTLLAGLTERLEQAQAELLTGHLDEPERGDLGNLVFGAVATQALDEPPQNQVAVRLEHHIDEVDDDDSSDVAETQLPHDLLSRLEVVLGDRLLEVSTRPDELAGIDVDDGHSLGTVDDERPARR